MRFFGNIEAKADAKGRLFLPASFRKILASESQEKLYMRKDLFQPCLVLYPETVWNAEIDRIKQKADRFNSRNYMLLRQFMTDVEEIKLDSNGRLLINKRYLAMAGINQDVRFIGMDETIEIWAKESVEEPFMNNEEFAKALEQIMTEQQ